jgi:wobble nucleotide-excising tRNase
MRQMDNQDTLSGGDRSALALSLFMTQLERAVSQPDIAVILDDPFQSQDTFRKHATAHQIKRAGEQCGQVIVLSHDPAFIKLVWDKLPPSERKALRLTSLGRATGLVPHDVDEHLKPEHQTRIDMIQRYVNEGASNPRDVAQKLRPTLEGYCKIVCPGEFPDTLMVGEICKRVRDAGPAHTLYDLLDELEELNDYAKNYHHATNEDHASFPIVEGELRGYGIRILEIMRVRI